MRDKAPTAESFSHSRDLPQRTLKRIPQFKLCEQYALSNVVNLTRELELIHNHKKQMLLQKQRGHRLKTVS